MSENQNTVNAALSGLYLQNETAEILKRGKLNTRLMELAVILYCKQWQIDYQKLTKADFRWLIRVLQKSKIHHSGERGKR